MDSTYAPQSPDLSGFLASPSKQPQPQSQQYQQQFHQPTSSYAPRSPVLPAAQQYQAQAQQQQQQQQQHTLNAYSSNSQIPSFGGVNDSFAEYGSSGYMPPIPALPPAHSFDPIPTQGVPPFYGAHSHSQSQSYIKPEFESQFPSFDDSTMSSRAKPPPAPAQEWKNPNPNNIDIKTKFPVARIKRIMQADEEVGKVAQVTPVAVSKALELFMIALVTGAAEKAKEKGGKRVTAQHLKQVVLERNEEFDFLADIVGKVAEGQEGAGGEKRKAAKEEKDSDSEDAGPKKRKGKGGRRKKGEE